MRHQADPVWRQILDRWRLGDYRQDDIDFVNKVAYTENWSSQTRSLQSFCPVIVTSNALRVTFNASVLRAFCRASNEPLHVFYADVKRARIPLTTTQRRSLNNIRDDKTSGMPIRLEIAIGAIVQCTKNVSMELKLAKGSIGTVVGLVFAKDDAPEVQCEDGLEVHIHPSPPEAVLVKLKDYPQQVFSQSLPKGVVPLRKRTEAKITIEMSRRSFAVTVSQVPLVPAYSLTTEKCQGLTVDKMILAPLKHSTRRVPQRSSFYVAVTRVRSLRQLYLMEPLDLRYLQYFAPTVDVLAENERLEKLEKDTATMQ